MTLLFSGLKTSEYLVKITYQLATFHVNQTIAVVDFSVERQPTSLQLPPFDTFLSDQGAKK